MVALLIAYLTMCMMPCLKCNSTNLIKKTFSLIIIISSALVWKCVLVLRFPALIQWISEPDSISDKLACCAINAQRDICPISELSVCVMWCGMLCRAFDIDMQFYSCLICAPTKTESKRIENFMHEIPAKFHKQHINCWTLSIYLLPRKLNGVNVKWCQRVFCGSFLWSQAWGHA